MGRFIKDRYEAEFIVERPHEQVWASLEERPTGNHRGSRPGRGYPGMSQPDR